MGRLYKGEIPEKLPKLEKILVFCVDHGSFVEYDSVAKLGEGLKQDVFYGAGQISSGSEILESLLGSS